MIYFWHPPGLFKCVLIFILIFIAFEVWDDWSDWSVENFIISL